MNRFVINARHKKSKINRNVYGHFSEHLGRCIYDGIFVGKDSPIPNTNGMRDDVVAALRQIRVPVLRWPGGCFADEYHWKDGVGVPAQRKKMVNTHWGGVVEDNSFGTHEFMELCRQLGCEPYVNGNVGSGTVQEMSEWVEYMTFDGVSPMAELRKKNGHAEPWKVKYFGVGNENWGCGGSMRPEYYADEYRRYQTYVRNYGENKICRIACGPNAGDYDWTEKLMAIAGRYMDALTLHYYTFLRGERGSATQFTKEDWHAVMKGTLRMEELVSNHSKIMDKYDPEKRVGLFVDEWGTWYNVEPGTNPGFLYQQNTMRDAVAAAINLNIFNRHSDRVTMANIAQMVNVLQAVILTEGDKMVLTPTYHVFDMYKNHQDATLVESYLESGCYEDLPALHQSVSEDGEGNLLVTVANLSLDEAFDVETEVVGKTAKDLSATILAGAMDAFNTFDRPDCVKPQPYSQASVTENGFRFHIPPCSVLAIQVK